MTQLSNVPLTAACDRSNSRNGASVHDTSHLAARHTTAAASRGETPVPAADSVRSAVSSAADLAALCRGNASI
jgi:hypothetical protein